MATFHFIIRIRLRTQNTELYSEKIFNMESCDMSYDLDSGNNVLRKGRKLLAEKKRRARINSCLGQIKSIICGGHKQNDPNYSKMEKAEILESTVKYLRTIRRDRTIGGGSHVTKDVMMARYKSGFSKCAEEIVNYLQGHPGIPDHLQRQIRRHLSKKIQSAAQTTSTDSDRTCTRLSHADDYRIQTSAVAGSSSGLGYLDNSLGSSAVRDGNSFSDSENGGLSKFGYLSMSSSNNNNNSNNRTTVQQMTAPHSESDDRVRAWLHSTYVSHGLSRYESRELFSSSPVVKAEDVWRPW
ncbi:protein hairy-like [Gigantopelta aegis]|uniref:protein hairy-like n=1 Tax=Gigantopelta aegis TaxID=1735272 RepID=UPI001B88BD3F|nr:protein hairy-like [Gigantopelta aegis]